MISVLAIPAWFPVRMSVPWSPVVRITGRLGCSVSAYNVSTAWAAAMSS